MDNKRISKIMQQISFRQVQILNQKTPSEDELNQAEPSADFLHNMQKILAEGETKKRKLNFRKYFNRVAIFVLLFFALSFGAVLSANASQADLIHFFQSYFAFNSGRVEQVDPRFDSQVSRNLHNVYIPTWVPEGFKATGSSQGEKICFITYTNGSKTIRFSQAFSPQKLFSDSELNGMTQISISNQKYFYGEKNYNVAKLVWKSDQTTFSITANLSRDEIIKLATNLKYKEG